MSQKVLYNKRSKSFLINRIKNETFKRINCSFYKYVEIKTPQQFRDELYGKWRDLKILGRTYVAKEGINSQISIPEHNWNLFIETINKAQLSNIEYKIGINNKTSFLKLIIKVKKQIVADGIEKKFDTSNVGTRLSPIEFNDAIDDKNSIVIDVRNHYESEVGHFKNAIRPDVDTFKESLPVIKNILKGKENNKILLYCTGGIRCEKTSAYLKHHNYIDVNQLDGGIINYYHQIKKYGIKSKFKGKNFVFDNRLGERITDDIISVCHQCYQPSDTHTNCANQACHILFIQCKKCEKKMNGCCNENCLKISNLPISKQKQIAKITKPKKRLKPRIGDLNNNII